VPADSLPRTNWVRLAFRALAAPNPQSAIRNPQWRPHAHTDWLFFAAPPLFLGQKRGNWVCLTQSLRAEPSDFSIRGRPRTIRAGTETCPCDLGRGGYRAATCDSAFCHVLLRLVRAHICSSHIILDPGRPSSEKPEMFCHGEPPSKSALAQASAAISRGTGHDPRATASRSCGPGEPGVSRLTLENSRTPCQTQYWF